MNFLISDTFTDSLARLTNDEQKAVKRSRKHGMNTSAALSTPWQVARAIIAAFDSLKKSRPSTFRALRRVLWRKACSV